MDYSPSLTLVMLEYLFSCEYATCAVPQFYREFFRGEEELVTSPRGWEPGALNLAQAFAMRFRTPLLHTEITRLLLDVEQEGEQKWSRFSRNLPPESQGKLMERYAETYHAQLDARIREAMQRYGRVLHVMVHTDPESKGMVVLETSSGSELSQSYAMAWQAKMKRDELRVRHVIRDEGSPLVQALADRFAEQEYVQIRLRVSQGFFLEGRPWRWTSLKKHLLDSLMLASQQSSHGAGARSELTVPVCSSTVRC